MTQSKTKRSLSRKTLVWTAGGAVAAVVGVVLVIVRPDPVAPGPSDESIRCGTVEVEVNGDNNDMGDIAYDGFVDCVGRTPTRERLEEAAAEFAEVDPSGDAPWPFLVGVGELGLIVRTSGDMDGRQIGTAGNGATLWVDCRQRTDFTPLNAIEDVGPLWLRVRWPNNRPDVTDTFNSQPSDSYTGYVYEAYAFPAGHNGRIPDC